MHPTVYHLSRLSSEIHLNSPRYATTLENGFGSTRKQKNRTARCGNHTPEKLLFLQWSQCDATLKGNEMLSWALTFLIVALIAAALGFTGIAGAASSIAQILFVIFIVLFVVAMVARAVRGQPPM